MGVAYDTNALEDILKNEMGTELKMSDVQHPKVLISAVDKSTTQLRLRFFNNVFNDEYSKRESPASQNILLVVLEEVVQEYKYMLFYVPFPKGILW